MFVINMALDTELMKILKNNALFFNNLFPLITENGVDEGKYNYLLNLDLFFK